MDKRRKTEVAGRADYQQTFDNIFSQAMEMADALPDGIPKQFPAKA